MAVEGPTLYSAYASSHARTSPESSQISSWDNSFLFLPIDVEY